MIFSGRRAKCSPAASASGSRRMIMPLIPTASSTAATFPSRPFATTARIGKPLRRLPEIFHPAKNGFPKQEAVFCVQTAGASPSPARHLSLHPVKGAGAQRADALATKNAANGRKKRRFSAGVMERIKLSSALHDTEQQNRKP